MKTCQTCAYCVDGRCRRFPPTIMTSMQIDPDWSKLAAAHVGVWPPVRNTDWCGEHKSTNSPGQESGTPQ